MIISVASGKGGTGKTTVSTNLALALALEGIVKADVQLFDCDVEEPNVHLFMHPSVDSSEPVIAPVPTIDHEKCTFCKKCSDICRYGALAVLKSKVLVFENLCHSCGGCLEICPEGAVIEKERVLGMVEKGRIGVIDFAQGLLEIGQVMVPPVIKEVKSNARSEAITIIDAPPGTSCPVIAAMKGADAVVLVTEPTPFGLHDLKLAVETVRILDLPHGVVINRAGLGNDEVKEYCATEGVPVLMEIPFDKKIAQVYSRGDLVVNAIPEYKAKFRELYNNIVKLTTQER